MNDGPVAYTRCLQKLYQEWLHGPRRPDLAALSPQQREALESACFRPKMIDGPGAYNQCLARRIESLKSAPSPARSSTAGSSPASSSAARLAAHRSHAKAPTPAAPSSAAQAAQAGQTEPAATVPQDIRDTQPPQDRHTWVAVLGILLLVPLGTLATWRVLGGDVPRLQARCPRCQTPSRFFGVRCVACKSQPSASHRPEPAAASYVDPFSVLGIRPGSTRGEIRAAYRREMSNYHPDKVAHLGPEIQQLAERKAHAINRAYAQLVK